MVTSSQLFRIEDDSWSSREAFLQLFCRKKLDYVQTAKRFPTLVGVMGDAIEKIYDRKTYFTFWDNSAKIHILAYV